MFFYAIMVAALLVFAPAGMASDGQKKPVSNSRIIRLYDQAKAAKTRKDVEKVLGKPIYEWRIPIGFENKRSFEVWYIGERESQWHRHESPSGLAGIVAEYDGEGKVIEIRCNFQWVKDEDVRAYHSLPPKEKEEVLEASDKSFPPRREVEWIPPLLRR